jgi:hypothetical protein
VSDVTGSARRASSWLRGFASLGWFVLWLFLLLVVGYALFSILLNVFFLVGGGHILGLTSWEYLACLFVGNLGSALGLLWLTRGAAALNRGIWLACVADLVYQVALALLEFTGALGAPLAAAARAHAIAPFVAPAALGLALLGARAWLKLPIDWRRRAEQARPADSGTL